MDFLWYNGRSLNYFSRFSTPGGVGSLSEIIKLMYSGGYVR